MLRLRSHWRWAALALLFVLLALARPLDHDESQYVAATTLTAHGLWPYRDFAYLQTPLQPWLFAPVAMLAGAWTWPMLRIVNALLGAVAVYAVWRAAREGGADARTATIAAGLFATCDIMLFGIGTARNDALPLACLALALVPMLRTIAGRAHRADAIAIGLLMAGAAAAKISYALPAIAYAGWAAFDWRRRPGWTMLGALPVIAFVGWTWWTAREGFVFGVFTFPAEAPTQWYQDRPWKLSFAAKAVDTLKFLALGPALLAAIVVARRERGLLGLLAVAGLVAALLPVPTWRQYLLPVLPPLFVALALVWHAHPPDRATRIAAMLFAVAGLVPSVVALAGGFPMIEAMRQSAVLRTTIDQSGVEGPIATLSPQFLPATYRLPDPRFAAGPFYFRSADLVDPGTEAMLGIVSRGELNRAFIVRPAAILTGGEGEWTSGDAALETVLARWASGHGYRSVAVPGGRFTLYVRPPEPLSPPPVPNNRP